MAEINMVKDSDGNIIYESHPDGFEEISRYSDGKMIYQKTKYSNGIVEVNHYSKEGK